MKTRAEPAFLVWGYKWLSLSMEHFLLQVFHKHLSHNILKLNLLPSFKMSFLEHSL